MDGAAIALATGAGITSSVGPCVAPRYLAMLAATADRKPIVRARIVTAFICGGILGYWLVANVAALAARALSLSSLVYAVLATLLFGSGIVTLLRADRGACAHRSDDASQGAMFLFGLTTSLVVSPCCTPTLAALGILTTQEPAGATIMVVAYSIGHLAPLILAGMTSGLLGAVKRHAFASRIVGAALAIALGCYYAVLA